MKWRERLALVTVLLAAAALWLPWVDHKAAALVLTGLDLPEFVRFMGEYRSGALRVQPLAYAAPVVAAALAGVAFTARSRPSFWGRIVAVAACLWLLTVPFPPLEKGRLLLAVAMLILAVHAGLSVARVSLRDVASVVAPLTTVAAVLPLREFAVMVPALNGLYGKPVTYGAGVYLEALAAMAGLVLCGAYLGEWLRRRSSAPAAPRA